MSVTEQELWSVEIVCPSVPDLDRAIDSATIYHFSFVRIAYSANRNLLTFLILNLDAGLICQLLLDSDFS